MSGLQALEVTSGQASLNHCASIPGRWGTSAKVNAVVKQMHQLQCRIVTRLHCRGEYLLGTG